MNDPQPEVLSPTGLARREAMLDELVEVVKRTRRTRRMRRRMLATGGCAALILMVIWLGVPGAFVRTDAPQFAEDSHSRPTGAAPDVPAKRRASVTVVIKTDPTVVERCRARPTGRIVQMDDRMLLETLAAIDRPAGLIRFGDQIRLSAAVTDAELGLRR